MGTSKKSLKISKEKRELKLLLGERDETNSLIDRLKKELVLDINSVKGITNPDEEWEIFDPLDDNLITGSWDGDFSELDSDFETGLDYYEDWD